jgi:hypothetical protein
MGETRRMLRRWTTWLAFALWLALVGLVVAIGVMKAAGWHGSNNTSDTGLVALFVAFFSFATMGALVAAYVPRNPLGWIFLAISLGAAGGGVAENLAYHGLVHDPGSVPGAILFAWTYAWTWYPTVGLIAFVLLLYPTGRPPAGRLWRVVAGGLGATLGAVTVLYMLYPGPLDGSDSKLPDNPVGLEVVGRVLNESRGSAIVNATVLLLMTAAATSVVWRFWKSHGDERQQMKWMAFAAVFLAGGAILPGLVGIEDTGDVFFSFSILLLPVSLGIAMFKYRLYDIDRVINKTLVYGTVTVLLAGAYVGLVIAGQELSSSLVGSDNLVIAVSTLVVAALFLPLRRQIQRFVDRRFYRGRYDAQRTLDAFAARLREQVDLDELALELRGVVTDTVQPTHASLWLREPAG